MLGVALFTALIGGCIYKLITGLRSVRWLPGLRVPFAPMSLFGVLVPTYWWNPGSKWSWEWRQTNFMSHKHEIISIVPFIWGRPAYHVGSLNAIKQILEAEQRRTIKPRDLMVPLLLWGENLISSNDEMWKRHRRIMGPAFSLSTLQVLNKTWNQLEKAMHNLVATRKKELDALGVGGERPDDGVFTRLVSELDEDAKHGLDKGEVIGNTFAMLFAGHETTANTLTATFGFLALYPEHQDQVAAEIRAVLGDEDPTLDTLSALPILQACFYESLRFFPAGVTLTRDVLEDISVTVSRPSHQTICLEKGSRIIIDMVGVHHDPNVFQDPESFKPERWHNVPEHLVSMFGLGPRGCIGRKFAVTEAMCFLALFLRDWEVDIVLQDGESREEYKDRVMTKAGMVGLAFGVGPITLQVSKRS
ncbi:hypothetical protein NLI96_g4303 [Meripilus lineatus]|uniref:Cytochrome P450 n=1 Tax=Meripilus lineatus TaxID=2056292 RepID=A0AAD5YK77_9APHY|nr:hypothetical protein NLI96_g4303 [Physisporinus lineatus]